jgi:hypothetical protein
VTPYFPHLIHQLRQRFLESQEEFIQALEFLEAVAQWNNIQITEWDMDRYIT